jgi:TonB-dependent starch-binding outer membrane protein SusC
MSRPACKAQIRSRPQWRAGRVLRLLALVLTALAVQAGTVAAQNRTISGRVVGSGGEPLVGAEVSLSTGAVAAAGRTAISTISGTNGTFTLQVPQGAVTLSVRMLGFSQSTVTVPADQSTVTVQLETDPLRLDELVITGQATGVQRRNLANAVATVSADQLNVVPNASVENMLSGKVAGADIQMNSGAPGGGNQVSLRGVSTIFGSATPLYVIDGVVVSDLAIPGGANTVTNAGGSANIASNQDNAPNRIADINPADIESIEILKGGSAAAIYGSQANNGVILITTKRGRAGETQFNLSQRFGVSRLANKLGVRQYTSAADAIAARGPTAQNYLAQFGGQIPGSFDMEEHLAGGNAPAFETALSMSGGTDQTRFYASGLLHNEDGVVTGTYYDKYTMALNLDQTVTDRLAFELRTSAAHTKTGRGFTGNDNTSTTYYVTLASTPSFIDLRPSDGIYPTNVFARSNPLQTAALVRNDEAVYRFIGSLRATYDIFRNDQHSLRLLGQGGADVFDQQNNIYAPEDVQFECLGTGCTPTDQNPGASVDSRSANRQYNFSVNAVHSFLPNSGAFTATTSAGVQYLYTDLDILRAQAEDLFPGQTNVNQAVIRVQQQQRSRSKGIGIYAQEELLFGERLLLTGSVRADRSSNNVEIDKWFYYPKVAGSYRIPVGSGLVNELKVRAAWGQAGLQPQYGQKFNNLNPGALGGFQTLALGNTTAAADLRPERQTEVEGGIDASFLGGRASLELTGYHQRVDDLILTRALAPSTGFTQAVFNNDGWMTNKGIEAAVRAVPVQSSDFSWTTGATFSLDRSKMDSLSVPAFNAPSAGFGTSIAAGRIQQGKSLTQLVGRDTVAVLDDPRCLEALNAQAGAGDCNPGTRFETALADGNPDFRMGFSNDFRYRSLSLTTTVDWQQGGAVNNLLGWLFDLARNSPDFADPCNLEGCNGTETLGEYRLRVYPARTSKVFLEDASFVKLREVALSWQVPTSMLQSGLLDGVDAARLTFSGRNLLRITDYKGMDPEVHNFGTTAIRTNIDVGPYPPSRSFWLSVDVRF